MLGVISGEVAKPKNADKFVKGAWHKVGVNDKVYIHDGVQWILSTKSVDSYNYDVSRIEIERKLDFND
tara:strand:+ start:40 stop:243 length:204 start_codon:yes stop_codon:yes gene_type:complete